MTMMLQLDNENENAIVSVTELERVMKIACAETILLVVTGITAKIQQGHVLDDILERLIDEADELQLDAAGSAKA